MRSHLTLIRSFVYFTPSTNHQTPKPPTMRELHIMQEFKSFSDDDVDAPCPPYSLRVHLVATQNSEFWQIIYLAIMCKSSTHEKVMLGCV